MCRRAPSTGASPADARSEPASYFRAPRRRRGVADCSRGPAARPRECREIPGGGVFRSLRPVAETARSRRTWGGNEGCGAGRGGRGNEGLPHREPGRVDRARPRSPPHQARRISRSPPRRRPCPRTSRRSLGTTRCLRAAELAAPKLPRREADGRRSPRPGDWTKLDLHPVAVRAARWVPRLP